MLRFFSAIFVLVLASTPAYANYFNRAVAAGGAMTGYGYYSINPDCSLLSYPTARVSSPPSNGVVSFRKGRSFPYFAPSNPRSVCNRTRVPSMVMEYRPARGFVGSDSFTVDVIFPSGIERTDTFNMTVK